MKIRYHMTTNYLEDCCLIFTIEQIEKGEVESLLDRGWSIKDRDIFTGLKDKNGVEVYEGDMVHWSDKYVGVIEWNTRMSGYYFIRNGSGFQFHEQQQINAKHGGLLHVEVIGNIHDQPDEQKEASHD